jgi:AcrR family transcriptional regulator
MVKLTDEEVPMAKSGRKSTTRGATSDTRDRLVDAAFRVVREQGFAHASARAIADRAGVNSALVFYYFDSVNALLVEALTRSSRAQLAKYEAAVADVVRPAELVAAVRERLADDMASGHVKVLAELLGASSSDEHLRAAVFEQVEPWMEFTRRTLERVLAASGLTGLVPVEQMAFVVVSLFLGMELLVAGADNEEIVRQLFDSTQGLVRLLDAVASPGATP